MRMPNVLVPVAKRRQRGVTLIESLVAFAVVSLGTVSVIRLQRDLRVNAELSGQRAEASHLGEGAIERLRADAGMGATPPAMPTATITSRNTRFAVDASAVPTTVGSPDDATAPVVSVAWPDTTGAPRAVLLHTVVGLANPSLSAALFVHAIDPPVARIAGRAATIPPDARNLGNGQSAWKPNLDQPAVWVFDNATGRIVSRCSGTSASVSTQDLTPADLVQCGVARTTLLSGIVRSSLAAPPDASGAADLPEALSVVLTLSVPAQALPPTCTTEAERSVEAVFGTGPAAVLRRQAVPLAATPASIGAVRWTDLGDRFVAYRCVVPEPPNGWTGRTTVVPAPSTEPGDHQPPPWTIGTSATARKVCRYVGPAGGSGSNDLGSNEPGLQEPALHAFNASHPAEYRAVTESLAQQNFLVIRGDQACPGRDTGGLASTEQQQP